MSVMSVGKKPKVLVRPLRAGNSRAGGRPGQVRAGEPGSPVSRPEKRNVPGVSKVAQPGPVAPPRPRAVRRHPPARPRLWVVPDAASPDAAAPAVRGTDAAGPDAAPPAAAGAAGPGVAGPDAAAGPRVPLVPRPRMAPDEQIPGPSRSTRPQDARSRAAGSQAAGPRTAGLRTPGPRTAGPRNAGPAASSRTRVVRAASAPSRTQVRRARRTRLTRRGRRVVWASAILLLVAVITPVLLAMASGAQAANGGLAPSAVRAGLRQVVVKPGQSLWSIAQNAEPHADPRVVSQQIIQYNALGSQVVVPGESLWVPRG
jgi:LysM domain